MSFDRERFVDDCVAAAAEHDPQAAVREVLARAVADHSAVLSALGAPDAAGLDVLHRSPTLTIFAAKWAPRMHLPAHDHRMWALIGIYTGREDNIFWRRIAGEADGLIEAAGARALSEGDCCTLGPDIIHSVINPIPRFTGALHIYGGDFFAQARSEWNPETLLEKPYSSAKTLRLFEEANRRTISTAE